MDITKLDIDKLKSLAYDEYVKLEIAQNNLRLINAEIQKKSKEEKDVSNNTEK